MNSMIARIIQQTHRMSSKRFEDNMTQGQIKPNKASSAASSTHTNAGIVKKRGSRQIKPKKAALIQKVKMNKKFTSGLTAQTEKMLGERAGHLEMLGQKKKQANAPKGHGAVTKQSKGAAAAKRKH